MIASGKRMSSRATAGVIGLIATGLALLGALTLAAPVEAKQIAAYPSPGSFFASPTTDIALNGVTRAKVGRITVRGSRTGVHPGRIVAWGGPVGVSFVPNRPFAAYERVTVTSRKHSFYGTGGRRSYSFRVGKFLRTNLGADPYSPPKGQKPREEQTYETMPLLVPKVTVNTDQPGKSKGKIFYAPRANGPTILDADGNLVWYRPGLRVTDFRAQKYNGRTVLTWWRRDTFGKRVDSKFEMANRHYKVFRRFGGGNGFTGDPHEFNLTSRGTAYVTAYKTAVVDMSRFGGPRQGYLLDYIGQEIDVKTGLVVWEWHPLGNLPLNRTYLAIPKRNTRPFDWFHMNSINDDRDGNVLISARHTQALYKVNKKTGRIMWQVGGKGSDFKLGKGVRFGYQHDLARQKNGTLTIFDNGAGGKHGKVNKFTSAKVLRMNMKRKRVTLVRAYRDPRNQISNSQGNVDVQPNGNLFVGWGDKNACTEFAPDGEVLFDFTFAAKQVSYRCYKMPWSGAPTSPIAVKSRASGSGSQVWMSWNGDTRVDHWRVLAGGASGKLELVATTPRTGFESTVELDEAYARYRVAGVSADGKVLGRSKINELGRLTR
jgi:hypothetical protein